MRHSKFTTKDGSVSLHPTKCTHWALFEDGNILTVIDVRQPDILTNYIYTRNEKCVFSKYKIQVKDSDCAAYCLNNINQTKKLKKISKLPY